MSNNTILGFFVMNCLAARVTPPGDANTVKNANFHTFHAAGTVGRNFDTARRQVGVKKFSGLRSFCKIAFPNSLFV